MIALAKNTTLSAVRISDLNGFTIPAKGQVDLFLEFPVYRVAKSAQLIAKISDKTLIINNGDDDLDTDEALRHISGVGIIEGPKDRSGKLRVHQTSRKIGLTIGWSGTGDDPSDPHAVWGGEKTTLTHLIGDKEPLVKYIDLNCVNNETWLHEGYLEWDGGRGDCLSMDIVPRVPEFMPSKCTNYRNYGGMVIPAAGDGDIHILSDLTNPIGGLVFMPPGGDSGVTPTSFWEATYNPDTKRYENITPMPNGDGHYNIFLGEVSLSRFINQIPLLKSGFIALNSSDTEQIGQGMRLRITGDTNNDVPDHDWSVAFILCLHRKKVI